MEKFKSFIKNLTNHEFAVFLMYQSEGLMPPSQEVIKEEIIKRNLTRAQLESYGKLNLTYQKEGEFCQRCGSDKIFNETEIEYENGKHFTREIEVSTPRCRLCNFNPSKEEKNLLQKIKFYFMGDPNQTKRVLKTYDWFGE